MAFSFNPSKTILHMEIYIRCWGIVHFCCANIAEGMGTGRRLGIKERLGGSAKEMFLPVVAEVPLGPDVWKRYACQR